MNNILF